jgi:hypothetical protein
VTCSASLCTVLISYDMMAMRVCTTISRVFYHEQIDLYFLHISFLPKPRSFIQLHYCILKLLVEFKRLNFEVCAVGWLRNSKPNIEVSGAEGSQWFIQTSLSKFWSMQLVELKIQARGSPMGYWGLLLGGGGLRIPWTRAWVSILNLGMSLDVCIVWMNAKNQWWFLSGD